MEQNWGNALAVIVTIDAFQLELAMYVGLYLVWLKAVMPFLPLLSVMLTQLPQAFKILLQIRLQSV